MSRWIPRVALAGALCLMALASARATPAESSRAPARLTIPAPKPTTQPLVVGAGDPGSSAPLSRAELGRMYARELGTRYKDADFDRIHSLHLLIEKYFAAPKAADRKALTEQIAATGIDAGIVGRLLRLRLDWPAPAGGSVFYVSERRGPHAVRYFYGVPAHYDRTRAWPLIIELPSPAPLVADGSPTVDQVLGQYQKWVADELAAHKNAVVVIPLFNLDWRYGPGYEGLGAVMQSMFDVADRANIDPARVYLYGESSGAVAAWNIALHYPTYFASFAAMGGAVKEDYQRVRLIDLLNVHPVVWQDEDDTQAKAATTHSLVNAVRGWKIPVDYIQTHGLGHTPSADVREHAFREMREITRELYPKSIAIQSVQPDTEFNRSDWLQIWQPLDPGKDGRVYFLPSAGYLSVFANPCRVRATWSRGNRIDITAYNVDSLRLLLNDQMIDFARPVTIKINGKVGVQGIIKPDIDQMLKDQLFLGRGWRYYEAAIDIDLVRRPPPATRPSTRPASSATLKSEKRVSQ